MWSIFNLLLLFVACVPGALDCSSSDREELFIKKLKQCSVIFDFSLDPVSDIKYKEVKRAALNELVDYVTQQRGTVSDPLFTDAVYSEAVNMVCYAGEWLCSGLAAWGDYEQASLLDLW